MTKVISNKYYLIYQMKLYGHVRGVTPLCKTLIGCRVKTQVLMRKRKSLH